jgi:hypothetical protein
MVSVNNCIRRTDKAAAQRKLFERREINRSRLNKINWRRFDEQNPNHRRQRTCWSGRWQLHLPPPKKRAGHSMSG